MRHKSLIGILSICIISFNATGSDTTYTDSVKVQLHFKNIRSSIWVIEGYQQFGYGFFCLGVGAGSGLWSNPKNFFYAISTTLETNMWQGIIGAKISLWCALTALPIVIGINGVIYNQRGIVDKGLRPDVGFGLDNFVLLYGYQFMEHSSIRQLNYHTITLRYHLPVIGQNMGENRYLKEYLE